MGKSSLRRVPADHFRTLYNDQTGKADLLAWSAQLGIPCLVGTGTALMGGKLSDVGHAVAGVSIVSGLLFSMSIFLFQLRMSLSQDKRLTENDYHLVDECMSNTLWAIVWGLALTVYLVIVGSWNGMSQGSWASPLTGIAAAAGIHFLIVIMMCIKRLRRSYERIAMKRA